jgi:hypothetical protein
VLVCWCAGVLLLLLLLLLLLVCRPIELPDGRPVYSYPLVVGHMMRLFEHLFVQPRFV